MMEKIFGEEKIPTAREEMIAAFRDVQSRLSAARREFEFVDEPELIEALSYEIMSLSHRENALLKKIKECGNE